MKDPFKCGGTLNWLILNSSSGELTVPLIPKCIILVVRCSTVKSGLATSGCTGVSRLISIFFGLISSCLLDWEGSKIWVFGVQSTQGPWPLSLKECNSIWFPEKKYFLVFFSLKLIQMKNFLYQVPIKNSVFIWLNWSIYFIHLSQLMSLLIWNNLVTWLRSANT